MLFKLLVFFFNIVLIGISIYYTMLYTKMSEDIESIKKSLKGKKVTFNDTNVLVKKNKYKKQ